MRDMRCKRQQLGGIFFFVGLGMFLQFMMPWWGFLLAIGFIALGFWFAYAR